MKLFSRARGLVELNVYYWLIALYFFAFGLQFILFPSIVTFVLQEGPARVGLAQTALSAPMFALLLIGGLVAERTRPARTLALLQASMAVASLGLAAIIFSGRLTYFTLLFYAVLVGSLAALLGPARDSALNGVVARVSSNGRGPSIAAAAAMTTSVQIGAQIGGIVVGRAAGAHPAPFLLLQAAVLLAAAGVALLLRAPRPARRGGTLKSALTDLREGLSYAFRNPVMGPMLISAAYSGVFIIGSLQVLFPLLIRENFGGSAHGQSNQLSTIFACFWAASFVSAVVLARAPPLLRPGRAMLASHMIGAVLLISFVFSMPFWVMALLALCFGLVAGVWISMSRTIAQSAAAPQYLGRVLAIYSMGFMGGAPIGSAVAGVAAMAVGPRWACLVPGLGLLAGAGALTLATSLWRLEADEHRRLRA
ncbi:MAG: MFS transporter [Hyphomonadaceae bacterium]